MQVTVGNQLRIENPSEQLLTWCKKQLLTIDVVDRDWYIRLARRYVRDFLGEKPPKRNTRRVNSIKKKLLEMLEV